MRNEIDACTSTQIPLQLELWAPEICDVPHDSQKGESGVVVIDLVQEDESTHQPGVIVLEL